MIPEHRRVLTLQGGMGSGKTTMAAMIAGALSRREGMHVNVYYVKGKEETTFPFYDKYCPGYTARLGMSYNTLTGKSLANQIVCVEDALAFMQSRVRRICAIKLVTVYARQDNIPTILTTQKSVGLPTGLKIDVRRVGVDCDFEYKMGELGVTNGWESWQLDVSKIIKAIDEGIARTHSGTLVRKDSFQSHLFELFDAGANPKQICEAGHFPSGSREYDKVYIYHRKWKLCRLRGKAG